MTKVFQEYDAEQGITNVVHDVDGRVVIQKSYDASLLKDMCAEKRAATEGQRWGEFRHVGVIPASEYAKMMRQDGSIIPERAMAWLRANPDMATFTKALKK